MIFETGIFPIERFVMESLCNKEKTTAAIALELQLDESIVTSILNKMCKKKYIDFDSEFWKLKDSTIDYLKNLKDEQIKGEIKELLEGAIDDYFDNRVNKILKLKKIAMNKTDMCALEKHFQNLEIFIQYLEEKGKSDQKCTAEKVIVFWGGVNYRSCVKQTIKNLL